VGCKDKGFEGGNEVRLGFTLTMWDVKLKMEVIEPATDISFTLTMWDVKDYRKTFEQ